MKNEAKVVKKNKNLLIIVTAVLLAMLLVFGIVMTVTFMIRDAETAMSYENIYISEGVASYLAASYKPSYLKSLRVIYGNEMNVEDKESFWNTEHPDGDGKTFGDVLCEDTEDYIKTVIVGAYLFDYAVGNDSATAKSLKEKVDSYIQTNVEEVLEYKAGGSEANFNKTAEEMGFDFSDFKEASRLLYKCALARVALFGEEGEALQANNYYVEATDFYNESYTRVKLLLIRTETDVVLNNGEPMKNEGGGYIYKELNEGERAARLQAIDEIKDAIIGFETGGDVQISETYFDNKIEQYNFFYNYKDGYYFSSDSEATAAFAGEISNEVVKKALSLDSNTPYAVVEQEDVGVYFLCRCELDADAFVNVDKEDFFGDFYSDFADFKYMEMLQSGAERVVVKDKYYNIDPVALPMNINFKIQE